MTCAYCGLQFIDGEAVEPAYRYWTTNEWGAEAYTDGVKRVGWAHVGVC